MCVAEQSGIVDGEVWGWVRLESVEREIEARGGVAGELLYSTSVVAR